MAFKEDISLNKSWVTCQIPKGYDLIGIQCAISGCQISKLGFKIWKPNETPEPVQLTPKLGIV